MQGASDGLPSMGSALRADLLAWWCTAASESTQAPKELFSHGKMSITCTGAQVAFEVPFGPRHFPPWHSGSETVLPA